MALSDNLIEQHRIAACDSGPLHFSAAMRFARAIEAEVRKDDEALIRQMREALELSLPDLRGLGLISPTAAEHAERHAIVIASARARLEKAP